MKTINTPMGPMVHSGSEEEAKETERMLERRQQFIKQYCKEKGWSNLPDELSLHQIMEIRKQPGWKQAGESGESKVTLTSDGIAVASGPTKAN